MSTEIISGPLSVYAAPVGESFPAIQDAPAGNWTLLGESGTRSMNEDGLTIQNPQEFFEVRVAGSTAVQKVFRTSEGLILSFTLLDLQAEEYARLLNDNAVTTTAASSGVAGEKRVNIYRGMTVSTQALLVKGNASPEQDQEDLQYEVPIVWQSSSPSLVYNKGEAVGLAFEYMALYDDSQPSGQELGRFKYQTADPT